MAAGHEMSGAWYAIRFNKQLTSRADRLKTMMLYYNLFTGQQTYQKWQYRRTSDVKYVRGADDP
jgi:hypothetical protein